LRGEGEKKKWESDEVEREEKKKRAKMGEGNTQRGWWFGFRTLTGEGGVCLRERGSQGIICKAKAYKFLMPASPVNSDRTSPAHY